MSTVPLSPTPGAQRLFPKVLTGRFETADIARTGLPESCADAVVSIDVFQRVEGHAAMLREIARVIKPAGRIVFTTWEGRGEPPGASRAISPGCSCQ